MCYALFWGSPGPEFGFSFGVWSMEYGWTGFSEQVVVPTLLSHPVFNHGWRVCREM